MVRSALDASPDGFNDYEKNLVAKVREYSWYGTAVLPEDDSLGFGYTLGFWLTVDAPEIISFSLDDGGYPIFACMFDALKAGRRFPVGQRVADVLGGYDAVLLPVAKDRYRDYLLSTRWFYGGDNWPCLQLIWPDPNGKFPWEAGLDPAFANSQPNLTGKPWPRI